MQSGTSSSTSLALSGPVRAAQYVRMSTENQRYSTLNQIDVIHEYAARRGINIVKTYADEGKSGLILKSRPALQQLLQDVVSGVAEFSLILVCDVSRWGRFQDSDEAAHYEFLCRQAGINIEYCAEQFDNDGNPMAALLKSIKRIMAAEFSRELSAKTFMGQRRVAGMGYRTGGGAGFGMRRLVVDEKGNRKAVLQTGQHKIVATDRTILIPGPPAEVAVIRYMYRACSVGKTYDQIGSALNKRRKYTHRGNLWTSRTVGQILRNEKYAGSLVWNKTSWKLRTVKTNNPKSEWVRVDEAFKPVVSRKMFDEAQQGVRKRMASTPEHILLEGLQRLLDEKGHLTKELIRTDKRIPGPHAYVRRFGSMLEAYKRVGFKPRLTFGTHLDKELFTLNLHHVADVAEKLRQSGRHISFLRGKRAFVVDQNLTVQFMILRSTQRRSGTYQWQMSPKAKPTVDVLVAARMDYDNQCFYDFLLLPREDVRGVSIRIIEGQEHPFEIYRAENFEPLYTMLDPGFMDGLPVRERILEAIRETNERARYADWAPS